ncbi:hypothetical protein [Streptomyces sp. URMC 123]|uniref:hypothetical protein n=1 Tax=Streptomyces sp. URMC 123 TaxID=3423403 RepID=UPI003F1CCC00
MRTTTRAVLLASLTGALGLVTTGAAVADSNHAQQKPVMLCNIVLLSPGAQVDGGCEAVQISNQHIVKQHSVSQELIDYVGVSPTGLL